MIFFSVLHFLHFGTESLFRANFLSGNPPIRGTVLFVSLVFLIDPRHDLVPLPARSRDGVTCASAEDAGAAVAQLDKSIIYGNQRFIDVKIDEKLSRPAPVAPSTGWRTDVNAFIPP